MLKEKFNTILIKNLDEVRDILEVVEENFKIYKTSQGYAVSFMNNWARDEEDIKDWEKYTGIKFPHSLAFSLYAYKNEDGEEIICTANASYVLENAGIEVVNTPSLAYCENGKLVIEKITSLYKECYRDFKGISALENADKEEYNLSSIKDLKWKSFKSYVESL